ncbi:hypothetical protein BOTBODRAFT_470618 [Botryobasidium botryosum FD-172 SS1]|uniref:Uncharacterized protein n=1 Tax=Botryobasidium botryosum (strain FD-172 SS1) TaxID=930990 RepID=A0A067M8K5_BOTB1|nr:hypothetical protein BOTBODRAFT_470618 [Botryobasidium botryosum FD-172 SS1]
MGRWGSFTMNGSSHQIEHLLPICTGYTSRLRVFQSQLVLPEYLPQRCAILIDAASAFRRALSRLLSAVRLNLRPPPRSTLFGLRVPRLSIGYPLILV